MLIYLLVVALSAAFYWKLRELAEENARIARRNANLRLELDAVRMAFLKRIDALEQQAGSPARDAPAAPVESTEAKPTEPVVEPVESPWPTPVTPPAPSKPPVPPEPEPSPTPPAPEPIEQPDSTLPPDSPSGVEWERLIGVRGAAILAAVVLGLAAVLFLQYSIEHGLIPPIVRVAIGLIVGAGAMGGSETLRKRGYATTANALAGGGAIVLYASVWAAKNLYDLIGTGLGFALMALTTAACGLLAWRHSAREIAVLGLAGGFAAPLLLSSGQDNPIGLFGYLLLLNAGLFALARERGWPLLTLLGLGATTFYQAGWITSRMGPERTLLGLAILGLFAVFFVAAGRLGPGKEVDPEQRSLWQWAQSGGVMLPFALALYFASRAELGEHLYPIAGLLLILCGAAAWIDRVDRFPLLPLGAAAASVAVFLVWSGEASFDVALSWEAVGVALALALVFHLFEEPLLRLDPEEAPSPLTPALLSAGGFLFALAFTPFKSDAPAYWPWLLGGAALAVLLVRQALLRELTPPLTTAAAGLGLGLGFSLLGFDGSAAPDHSVRYTAALIGAAAFHAAALRGRLPRYGANLGAVVVALLLLILNVPMLEERALDHRLYLGAVVGFAFLAALAATRLPSGKVYFSVTFLAALSHTLWAASGMWRVPNEETLPALVLLFASASLFALWPLIAGRAFLGDRWTIYAAALSGPLWFIALASTWDSRFGDDAIGVVPLALGALSLTAAARLRRLVGEADPARLRGLVWFAGGALSFIAIAIPLQLDKEWITIGWALQAFALLHLWKRLDHPGLKYFALALATFTIVRLILNPEIFEYHARSGRPVFNWLMYGYLVPAAALVGGALALAKLEAPRARPFEQSLYRGGKAWGAILCFSGAIVIVFAWINLTIFDVFSAGRTIDVSFERLAARDLTLSLAWALFALCLLGLAFRTKTQALRWTSLAFLLLTIGKVFLHDLGELEDLYRVASLVGLALSLLLVSIAYQRFVFGVGATEGKE